MLVEAAGEVRLLDPEGGDLLGERVNPATERRTLSVDSGVKRSPQTVDSRSQPEDGRNDRGSQNPKSGPGDSFHQIQMYHPPPTGISAVSRPSAQRRAIPQA
jgi:hypothetical protein